MATQVVAQSEEVVAFPELDELQPAGALVLQEFGAIVKIENDEQYLRVASKVLEAAGNINRITAHIDPQREAANRRWKRICDVKNRLLEPWEEIKKRGGDMIAVFQYDKEQARLRDEEAQRVQKQKEAEDLQRQQANQLADEGRVEEGIAVLESQPVAAPIVAPRDIPRAQGIGSSKITYKAEVTNLKTLIIAVAAGQAPVQALMADQKFLDKQAGAFRDGFSIPGVELRKSVGLSSVRSK